MSEAMEDRVANELTDGATPEQRAALAAWAARLLAIRDDAEDGFGKARSALRCDGRRQGGVAADPAARRRDPAQRVGRAQHRPSAPRSAGRRR